VNVSKGRDGSYVTYCPRDTVPLNKAINSVENSRRFQQPTLLNGGREEERKKLEMVTGMCMCVSFGDHCQ
jgi:hypothetical protein